MSAGSRKSRRFDWDQIKPQTPLNFGVRSNGELFEEPSARDRLIERLVLERADRNARRLGVSRRSFLASWAGMATTLAVANLVSGCGDGDSAARVECDQDGARALLDPNERFPFIVDVQTHHVDNSGQWRDPIYGDWQSTNRLYFTLFDRFFDGSCPQSQHHAACLGVDDYVDLVFGQSDTSVAVLSTFPAITCDQAQRLGYGLELGFCGNFLPSDAIASTRDLVNQRAGSQRSLGHAAVLPNPPSWLDAGERQRWLDEQRTAMTYAARDLGIRAWKCYTPFGALPIDQVRGKSFTEVVGAVLSNQIAGEGWYLDDEVGLEFIENAIALDARLINIHKGIPLPSFDSVHTSARDVGVVARRYPEVTFLVYHSAINFGVRGLFDSIPEGPYDPGAYRPEDDPHGINSLIHSVVVNGLSAEGKGSGYIGNVVAELGGPGGRAIGDAVQGTHIFGKLLKYIGENNIVWGTDAIWYGSPQSLIEGFVAFRMDSAISEQYDYPELTDERKAKILGLNAARIYGIDVEERRCELAADSLSALRREARRQRARNPQPLHPLQVSQGPRTRREFFALWHSKNWLPG